MIATTAKLKVMWPSLELYVIHSSSFASLELYGY